jgi:hypothetical protein
MRQDIQFWDEGRVGAADNMIIPWRIAVKIVLLLEHLIFPFDMFSPLGRISRRPPRCGASSSATRSLFKKACTRRSRSARMWRGREGVGCESRHV